MSNRPPAVIPANTPTTILRSYYYPKEYLFHCNCLQSRDYFFYRIVNLTKLITFYRYNSMDGSLRQYREKPLPSVCSGGIVSNEQWLTSKCVVNPLTPSIRLSPSKVNFILWNSISAVAYSMRSQYSFKIEYFNICCTSVFLKEPKKEVVVKISVNRKTCIFTYTSASFQNTRKRAERKVTVKWTVKKQQTKYWRSLSFCNSAIVS